MNNFDGNTKKQIILPDLPDELIKDQYKHETFKTLATPPFFSTTESFVTEKYNASPYLLRSTMYTVPSNEFYMRLSHIPFGIIVSPFDRRSLYTYVNGVDFCTECRSVLNCFTSPAEDFYICNICGKKINGVINNITNLNLSSIECETSFNDSKNSFKNNNNIDADTNKRIGLLPPAFVFIVDAAFPGISELLGKMIGMLESENFTSIYQNIVFIVILKMSMVLFSNNSDGLSIMRIALNGSVPEIPFTVAIDTRDTFKIRQIIRKIDELISLEVNSNYSNNIRSNVIDSSKDTNKAIDPKKDIDVQFSKVMETIKYFPKIFAGTNVAYFSIENGMKSVDYKNFVTATKSVAVNFFMKTVPASVASLAFYTGGTVFRHAAADTDTCACDFETLIFTPTVYDVSLVLKVSDNIVKDGVIAYDVNENLSLTRLPAMNSGTSITFILRIEDSSKKMKYAQLVTRFTDTDGTRRMRVINHAFPNGDNFDFFSGISFDTLFAVLVRLAITEQRNIEEDLVKMLVFYRRRCAKTNSIAQFIIPEQLKPLPVLIQAFSKHIEIDKLWLIKCSVEETLRYFYPRMFPLSDYSQLPYTRSQRLSVTNLNPEEIYIMENGRVIFIYVGKKVDSALFNDAFIKVTTGRNKEISHKGTTNISNASYRDNTSYNIAKETETGKILIRLIDEIVVHYGHPLQVRIIMSGSVEEIEFLSAMIEDRFEDKPDYTDFIYKIHIKVHNDMSSQ